QLDDAPDHIAVLFFIQRGGLTRRTHCHNGIGAVFDVKFYQPGQALVVDRAILPHRRYQRHHAAAEHERSPPEKTKVHTTWAPGRTQAAPLAGAALTWRRACGRAAHTRLETALARI